MRLADNRSQLLDNWLIIQIHASMQLRAGQYTKFKDNMIKYHGINYYYTI